MIAAILPSSESGVWPRFLLKETELIMLMINAVSDNEYYEGIQHIKMYKGDEVLEEFGKVPDLN